MNRRIAMAAAAAACILTACSEKIEVSHEMEGMVTDIHFCVPIPETKLSGTVSESAVNSLQIFVFGMDGKIEAYGTTTYSSSLSLTCTTGEKDVVALVNAAPQEGILYLSDLKARTTDLSGNTGGYLVMEGITRKKLKAAETVTVPVSRCASRVTLTNVSTDFELDVYNDMEFKITKVMLTNVAGDKPILGNAVPSVWYNKRGAEPSALSVISDAVDNVAVTRTVPYSVPHYFYCYPNPVTTDSTSSTWSVRKTRLVVVTTLGGCVYYYPVTLPVLEANKLYSVSLTVTRPGSTDIDIPVEKVAASVSVTVNGWGTGASVNETI
ncbi:MAG: fimbrial protein [Candidatus Cryptobacteroides sp.]